VATALEFPLVWAVGRLSPARLAGFEIAAVANSALWGIAIYLGYAEMRGARKRRA
jgi:hypothetical protein